MKRLWLFAGISALLLGRAAPPPLPYDIGGFEEEPAALETAPTLDYDPALLIGDTAPIAPAAPPAAVAPPPEPKGEGTPQEASEPSPAPLQATSSEGLKVVVSIPQQKMYVFEDGDLLATSPVSTGKRGHETPTGTFPILQKKVHHRSNRYANAPMPYMQRLTHYGIALHAGSLPGYPASHGCIRLPRSFAKKLYGLTDYGTRVTITRKRPKSPEEALNLA